MHLDQLSGALLAIFADLLSGYCNLGQTTQTKALVIIQAPTTAHCPCCQGMLVTVLLAFQFIWAIQMPVPGRRRPRSEDSKAQARIILILFATFHCILNVGDLVFKLNPGPDNSIPSVNLRNQSNRTRPKAKCLVCSRTVAINHRAVDCDQCKLRCRIKCGNVSPKQYKQMISSMNRSWTCPICSNVNTRNNASLNTDGTERNAPSVYKDLGTKLSTDGLRIAHINVRSLRYKINEIKIMLSESKLRHPVNYRNSSGRRNKYGRISDNRIQGSQVG